MHQSEDSFAGVFFVGQVMEHLTLIKDWESQVTHYLKKAVAKKRLSMERDAKGKPSSGHSSSTTTASPSHPKSDPVHLNGSDGSTSAQVRP